MNDDHMQQFKAPDGSYSLWCFGDSRKEIEVYRPLLDNWILPKELSKAAQAYKEDVVHQIMLIGELYDTIDNLGDRAMDALEQDEQGTREVATELTRQIYEAADKLARMAQELYKNAVEAAHQLEG
jgi:hypothetical protein